METLTLWEELLGHKSNVNTLFSHKLLYSDNIKIYSQSIIEHDGVLFFIAKENDTKYLFLLFKKNTNTVASRFEGDIQEIQGDKNTGLKRCNLTTNNRKALQKEFEFTNPKIIGLVNSFGFGDRIGLANPAHIRSLGKSGFFPVLAQQSIRELTRTNRTPAHVMDAAVWAVFQEGYTSGFSADADHLKTTADIDIMVENGFKMFTFDPGEFVYNEADTINEISLNEAVKNIDWEGLHTKFEKLSAAYLNSKFHISDDFHLEVSQTDINRAALKYVAALAHIKKLYDHLKQKYPNYESEVEVSVDETDSVTSPFEHFFIVKELNRLGVKIVSLAPRFVGSFEKGIDYKGDLNLFKQEYLKHLAISKYFGNYKISLHSGSDKFSVYKVIGEINDGFIHVKTAGTSYLEALRVVAVVEPNFFRQILDYSTSLFDLEKKSYHVSADINKLKSASKYSDKELVELFGNTDCRQALHVTFGRILTDKNEKGEFIFKDKILKILKSNEKTHYEIIIEHFHKHLTPFSNL